MAEAVGVRAIRSGSRLERVLASGAVAVTAEIAPPASADATEIRQNPTRSRGAVDACNVTDCTRARVQISSLAAAAIVLQEGVEPVMQMVVRDRNRIALQADLLGAAALGVRNVLCLWGDPPSAGNEREAKGVFDLKTEEMIEMVRNLRESGTLRGGDTVETPPMVFIGAAADPFRGSKEESFGKLRAKVMAGADFVQTQGCYAVASSEGGSRLVRKGGLPGKGSTVAGVIPLKALKMAGASVGTSEAVEPSTARDR